MKTIKPDPLMLIITGFASVLAVIGITVGVSSDMFDSKMVVVAVLAIGAFIFYLVKHIRQKKVQFNDRVFVVDGNTYNFSDISNADAEAVPVTRHSSTLRIEIYVNSDFVFEFKKNDVGAEEFIANMKRHNVKITIDD